MKAAVNTRYGSPDVIQIREVPKPTLRRGEVLIKVHATTVSRTDCGQLRAHPFFIRLITGLVRPRRTILGTDFSGEIEAVGEGVVSFTPGDRVFGLTPGGYGGHAEYLSLPEDGPIAAMPSGLGFDDVVVGEGAWYADTYLQAFGLGPGHNILIYGASGAIGAAAVQLAKYYGAEVTAVVAAPHVGLARSLGADRVIDFTAEDFTKIGDKFDFVMDAVGKTTFFRCRKVMKPEGVFAAADLGPHNQNVLLLLWAAVTRSKRIIFPLPKARKGFVEFLRERLEAGEFRAVIDRKYPLEGIVEAYRYVETGKKTGIVVIQLTPNDGTTQG
ncbi:MAG: NAD(P)-dependent alcohol dehydrogenase [Actinobacteria bacterium]|nr:NAD(P)-dependent alcohol dehydrogenase [Actinomycetota bacterium]